MPAFGESCREPRPALTVPARAGFQYPWGGAKKRDSKSNKENGMKKVKECGGIVLDFGGLIEGLLGAHSRYGLHTRAVTNS